MTMQFIGDQWISISALSEENVQPKSLWHHYCPKAQLIVSSSTRKVSRGHQISTLYEIAIGPGYEREQNGIELKS